MAVRLGAIFLGAALALAACSDSSSTTTTSAPDTTSAATPTTAPDAGTGDATATTSAAAAATTTTAVEFSLPEFTILERTENNVLVVAIQPGTYTDIDLQNLVGEVVELFAPVRGLHVVDDPAIAQLVLADTITAEEQALLDEHYFVRLEEGFRMVFEGPFSGVGDVILGS